MGLGRFMRAADMALQEEAAAAAAQPAADSGGTGAPAPTRRPLLRCSSWALRVVDRLLPQSAAHAAAAAYASVAVSQLLHPKAARGRGLCMAAALWLNSLALFGAGCAAGVLLLAQFMGAGVRLLCRANCLMAGALAMPAATPAVDCNGPGIGSPRWLVCIVCACAAVLVAESRRGGRPGGAALLLRLERHGPRLLLQLYLAVFLLAGNMLLLVSRSEPPQCHPPPPDQASDRRLLLPAHPPCPPRPTPPHAGLPLQRRRHLHQLADAGGRRRAARPYRRLGAHAGVAPPLREHCLHHCMHACTIPCQSDQSVG